MDDITARQITAAIDTELAKKGLTKTDADNADLYIAYQTAIGSEKQWSAYNTGWGYGPRWGGGGMGTATSQTIHTGHLDLDMYDSANKRLVWKGVVSKTVEAGAKPDKRQKNITKSIEKLLKTIRQRRSSGLGNSRQYWKPACFHLDDTFRHRCRRIGPNAP